MQSLTTPYDYSLDQCIRQLQGREPFAISRWGDGEWSAVLGRSGVNCDKHQYTAALKNDLQAVLRDKPDYILAIQSLAIRKYGPQIAAWLTKNGLTFQWCDARIFHAASIKDRLGPLIAALADRKVILVGPDCLNALKLFPVVGRVIVPPVNCHVKCDRVTAQTATEIERTGTGSVVAISASMSANVIIHRLHKQFPDATLIDFGSLWEPYVGLSVRSYHVNILKRLAESK